MAISPTLLTAANDAVDRTSYTTASVAPSGNVLLLLAIENSKGTDPADAVNTVTGNGLTWVQVATIEHSATPANAARRLSVFRSMGASPSSGTIVIDYNALTQTGCSWSLTEFSGVDTSGTNGSGAIVQSATAESAGASDTSLTVTLSAFGDTVNNAAYGAFWAGQNTEALVAGSGFTALSEVGHGSPAARLQTEWKLGQDTSVDATWTTGAYALGLAIEIKAGAVVPVSQLPLLGVG